MSARPKLTAQGWPLDAPMPPHPTAEPMTHVAFLHCGCGAPAIESDGLIAWCAEHAPGPVVDVPPRADGVVVRYPRAGAYLIGETPAERHRRAGIEHAQRKARR